MGFMDILKGVGKIAGFAAAPLTGGLSAIPAAALSAGGALLGGATDAIAANRGTKLDASLNADALRTQRQGENRAERDDAWKKLQQAAYTRSSQGYTPPELRSDVLDRTRTLPAFGIARTGGPSASVMQGAQGLESEVLKRLMEGSQLPPITDVNQASKMGGWEKLLNVLGPALSVGGAAKKTTQPQYPSYTPLEKF